MKDQIADLVTKLATYFDKKLSPMQIAMYAEDLSCLTPEQLAFSIKEYRRNPENVHFPLPAKLIGLVNPLESDLDTGRVVAGRILTAIGKYGYTNPQRAREFIGELGWEVVRYQGGWNGLCALSTEELKTEQPRLRDLAVTLGKKSKAGTLHSAPALPTATSERVSQITSNAMKRIEIKKETA